jgi:DNA-binding response OmpR family regulator
MHINVLDQHDELFAYIVTTIAQRRGHTATQLKRVDQLLADGPAAQAPTAVVLGVREIDADALALVVELRQSDPNLLLYLVAEEALPHKSLAALEAGATDVFQKPILPREILVRAELAVPRRERGLRVVGVSNVGDISVDLDRAYATKAGKELILTRMELRLLCCLLEHHGRIAPTDRLLTFGWESEEPSSSTLKTHMSHLRQKLTDAGGLPFTIRARQMLGYILTVDTVEESQTATPMATPVAQAI